MPSTTLAGIPIPLLQPGAVVHIEGVDATPAITITIERMMGDGGTGTVYCGRSPSYPFLLAIKIPHGLRHGVYLFTEARWTPRPSSQYYCYEFMGLRSAILPDMDHDIRIPVTLARYYAGGDLTQYLKIAKKCPRPLAMCWIAQVAIALRTAQVVHRDLKTDNIYLNENQDAYVADYGLAVPAKKSERDALGIQMNNWLVGTPEFMSPEALFYPHLIDLRSDIYALGLIAYELVTGIRARISRPEDGKSDVRDYILELQSIGFALDLSYLRDAKVRTVIEHCTAVKPSDRYQDYDQLVADVIPLANV